MRIASSDLLQARLPLIEPYPLSFTTVTAITSIVVVLRSDQGTSGVGEAVPLPGYSDETKESIVAALRPLLPKLDGLDSPAARELLNRQPRQDAFALSAVATALDLMTAAWTLPERGDVPSLAPLAVDATPAPTLKKANTHIASGFKTLKLKVGRDVEAEIATTRELLSHLPEGIKLRIDANQAYSLAAARRFLAGISSHPRVGLVEHLEQPFGVDETGWDNHRILAKEMNGVELMLDESIFDVGDVKRAVDLGANAVKLKLFKHSGPNALLDCAKTANSHGMRVILGNGVSSGIGNLTEAGCFASGAFSGAFEGNGFSKLGNPAIEGIVVRSGNVAWDLKGECNLERKLSQKCFSEIEALATAFLGE